MSNDRNGKLMTEQEAVLKIWESYFKEQLDQEGNYNNLELPSYVEGKVELTDITDIEMQTRDERDEEEKMAAG